MYLLIHPNVSRAGPDYGIISSSINFGDSTCIVATFPWQWQPCDALLKEKYQVQDVRVHVWAPFDTSMQFKTLPSNITVRAPRDDADVLVSIKGLNATESAMLCQAYHPVEDTVNLSIDHGARAQQTLRAFSSICLVSHTVKLLEHRLTPGPHNLYGNLLAFDSETYCWTWAAL